MFPQSLALCDADLVLVPVFVFVGVPVPVFVAVLAAVFDFEAVGECVDVLVGVSVCVADFVGVCAGESAAGDRVREPVDADDAVIDADGLIVRVLEGTLVGMPVLVLVTDCGADGVAVFVCERGCVLDLVDVIVAAAVGVPVTGGVMLAEGDDDGEALAEDDELAVAVAVSAAVPVDV